MSIARDPRHDAPAHALHPLLALMAPPLELDAARDAEAAARALMNDADVALHDASLSVSPSALAADPDALRSAAAGLVSSRAAAVVAYRGLGTKPEFDVDAEHETCRALDALDAAVRITAERRRRSHLLLGAANAASVTLLLVAAFKVTVLVANPASAGVAQLVITAGVLPVTAFCGSAVGVLRAARAARKLRPQLDHALRRSGCRSIRELAARRDAVDEWAQRARIAAAEGDRCARAVRQWYDIAGIGADAADVERLIESAAWARVARATWERARFAHRVALAQLERAEADAMQEAAELVDITDAVSPATTDPLGAALQRLKGGRVLRWRR